MHTKLSSPFQQSNVVIGAEKEPTVKQHDSLEKRRLNKPTTVEHSSVSFKTFDTNIFLKEFNIILYDDDKNKSYEKVNVASMFFDDFIVCFTEEVTRFQLCHSIL